MNKAIITLFFSLIFFTSITTPTLLIVLDSSCEISLVEDINNNEEEEGKNNKESSKDLESKIFYPSENTSLVLITRKTRSLSYYFKKYASISKKLFLPPPEHSIA